MGERVCVAAQLRPEGRKREPCSFVLGEKVLRGESSTATPVRCFEASAIGKDLSPEAGS